MKCDFADTKANNIASYVMDELDEDTRTFIDLYTSAEYGDKLPVYLRGLGEVVSDIDKVVRAISEGTIESLDEIKGNDAKTQWYKEALGNALESLFRAADDPAELLMQASSNHRILSAYRRMDVIQKADTLAYRAINGFAKMFGLGEIWANRPNYIRHFEPAAETYFKFAQIENFVKSYNNNPTAKIANLIKTVDDSSIFKRYGISPDIFNKVFGLFDDMYVKQLSPEKIAGLLEEYQVNILGPDRQIVYNEFLRMKEQWNIINYGMTDADLKEAIGVAQQKWQEQWVKDNPGQQAPQELPNELSDNNLIIELSANGSIVGNFRYLRNMVNNLYESDKGALMGDSEQAVRHRQIIETAREQFNEMAGRFGYVPGNQNKPSFLENLYDVDADWRKTNPTSQFLAAFTFARSNDSFDPNGSFTESALTLVKASGIMFSETARIIAYNKIKQQVEDNADWFKSSASRRAIQGSLKEYLHDLEVIIETPKERDNMALKVARRVSSTIGVVQASILMGPGSAINNTIGANFMLTMLTGSQHFLNKYEADLKQGFGIAEMVKDYYDKTMLSPGIIKEFQTFTPIGRNADMVDNVHDYLQKLGDKIGDGVLNMLPVIKDSNLWGKTVTGMKSSEERIREHAKGLGYNKLRYNPAMTELLAKPLSQISQEDIRKVQHIIEANAQRVFYDMMAGAGDFSSTARPFIWHTKGDTTNNVFGAYAGAVAKLMYAFVHPTIVNVDGFMHTLGRMGLYWSDKATRAMYTPEMRRNIEVMSMMGGIGISMAFYEFYRDAIRADHDSVQVGLTETLNPFQNLRDPMNLFYASVIAPIIGSPISEDAYKNIVASNVKFMMNMAGGREAQRAIEGDEGMRGFMKRMTAVMDLPSVLYDTIVYPEYTGGDVGILYNKRRVYRDAWGNLTASDPIGWLSDITELVFLRDPNNQDQVMTKFDRDRITKMVTKFFGVSVWRNNPQTVFKAYGSRERASFANNRANRYSAKTRGMPRSSTSAAEFQRRYIAQYGRFPTPVMKPRQP